MIPLSAGLSSALQQRETFPVRLFEIGGSTTLRYTDADIDVAWNGHVWERRGISYSKVRRKLGLETDTYDVAIDNLDDVLITWMLTADQRGHVTQVYKGLTAGATNASNQLLLIDDAAVRLFSGRNTSFKADAEFEITVTANLDFHDQAAPRESQMTTCRFRFKDANCGYTGDEVAETGVAGCNFTEARCRQLHNFERFGGFPDLNSQDER